MLIVAVDGSTEFLAGAPVSRERGVAELCRGAASWADTILATSDPRIDFAPWGKSTNAEVSPLFSCDGIRDNYSLVLLAGGGRVDGVAQLLAPTVDDVLLVVALGNTRTEVALGMSSRLASLRRPLRAASWSDRLNNGADLGVLRIAAHLLRGFSQRRSQAGDYVLGFTLAAQCFRVRLAPPSLQDARIIRHGSGHGRRGIHRLAHRARFGRTRRSGAGA